MLNLNANAASNVREARLRFRARFIASLRLSGAAGRSDTCIFRIPRYIYIILGCIFITSATNVDYRLVGISFAARARAFASPCTLQHPKEFVKSHSESPSYSWFNRERFFDIPVLRTEHTKHLRLTWEAPLFFLEVTKCFLGDLSTTVT